MEHIQLWVGPKIISVEKRVESIKFIKLPKNLPQITKASDYFISRDIIYLVLPGSLIQYKLGSEDFETLQFPVIMQKLIAFDNQFYYWRTQKGVYDER